MRRTWSVLLFALALAAPSWAEESAAPVDMPADAGASPDAPSIPADFRAYQTEHEMTCVGPVDGRQASPTVFDQGGFHFEVDGSRAKISRKSARSAPDEIRIGLISSIKDDEPETRANVDEFLQKFTAADVDAILVGGDTALNESEIEPILVRLGRAGVPVLVVIGNAENRSAFNRAVLSAHLAQPNVINVDLVRVVNLDGWDLVSLPGYGDKRYTHQSGPCVYKPEDVKALKTLAAPLAGPVVLLTHGPPRQAGKLALDYVPEAGNVGDPDLTAAITAAKIPFGVFGHILEAAGHGTDLVGKKEIKPGVWAESLYLNPGGANSLPWRMNSGPESYGMAMLMTLSGHKAKYELFRSVQRVGKTMPDSADR